MSSSLNSNLTPANLPNIFRTLKDSVQLVVDELLSNVSDIRTIQVVFNINTYTNRFIEMNAHGRRRTRQPVPPYRGGSRVQRQAEVAVQQGPGYTPRWDCWQHSVVRRPPERWLTAAAAA